MMRSFFVRRKIESIKPTAFNRNTLISGKNTMFKITIATLFFRAFSEKPVNAEGCMMVRLRGLAHTYTTATEQWLLPIYKD